MSQTLLTLQDVAGHFRISTSTVRRLVAAGRLPRPLKVGRGIRFRLSDVEEAEGLLFIGVVAADLPATIARPEILS